MQTTNRFYLFFGLVTVGLGSMPFLAAMRILPTRTVTPGDAPNWIAFAIGLAFVLAGIMVIVRGLAGADNESSDLPQTAPRALRVVYELLEMPIPILLAAILSWVAFGPGERHFMVSGGAGGLGVATAAGGDIMGRVAFGFGAVLAWSLVGYGVLSAARRWFPRDEP